MSSRKSAVPLNSSYTAIILDFAVINCLKILHRRSALISLAETQRRRELWAARRGWVRPLYWRTARRWCGTTLRELGAPCGVSHAAVSLAIRRWEESGVADAERRQLQETVERLLHVTP